MATMLSALLLASLVSTCHAQFNDGFNNNGGWRGSYSAGIVIGMCCSSSSEHDPNTVGF
jgi:hypothetical protein